MTNTHHLKNKKEITFWSNEKVKPFSSQNPPFAIEISDAGGRPIDFALFGCPHCTLDEIREITEAVSGKKLRVPLWIMASAYAEDAAVKMGYADILREADGDIIKDTCSDQPCWHFLKGKTGVTDSPKLAYYPRKRGLGFVVTPTKGLSRY